MSDFLSDPKRSHYYPQTMNWTESLIDIGSDIHLRVVQGKHSLTGAGSQQPCLVLLHEALGHLDMWKDFPAQLAQSTGLDVLIYERRGYGGSSAGPVVRDDDYLEQEGPLLVKLLEQLQIASVILVGHSDGGSIALLAAGLLTRKVKAVVTMAAHIRVDRLTLKGVAAARRLYQSTDLPERLARYHLEKTDQLFWLWNDTWLRESFQQLDLTPHLKSISCPALILQGVDDQYAEMEQVTDICAAINAGCAGMATSLFLDDCCHVPHIEAKTACIEAVSDFCQSVINSVNQPV